jgi:predicted amino acid dehydrogenase
MEPHGPCLGKFAFLIHPTTLNELYDSGPPAFDQFTSVQRAAWQDWIASWSAHHYEPGIAYHLPAMHSCAGGYAEGWLLSIPLTPDQMMHLRPRDRAQLMAACVSMAKSLQADILGLGAFTSIITRNGAELDGCGMNITTGNSLTAMVAAESIKRTARLRGKTLLDSPLGIIGAAGSVGRLACKHLADECGNMTLFGNPENPQSLTKLKELAGEIYQAAAKRTLAGAATTGISEKLLSIRDWLSTLPEPLLNTRNASAFRDICDLITWRFQQAAMTLPISLSVNLQSHLWEMQFLISATNQGKSFIDPDLLGAGAVVCDVARPADVYTGLSNSRPDLTVYEGGLLRLPQQVRFGHRNVVGCETGINLACLSETMTLALSGVRRNYSVGSEPPLEDAREILRLALHHGFEIISPADREPASDARTMTTCHPVADGLAA